MVYDGTRGLIRFGRQSSGDQSMFVREFFGTRASMRPLV